MIFLKATDIDLGYNINMSVPVPTGHILGLHRVMDDPKVLPQNADRLNADLSLYDNEALVDVTHLQIDSASFKQLKEAHKDGAGIATAIQSIVAQRGKMQNPVTGSGGMLMGRVIEVGSEFPYADIINHSKIATLVSLTATPLIIESIERVDIAKERISVKAKAILFPNSLFSPLPNDILEGTVLAAFDICGAPLLVEQATHAGCKVFIMGLGKAGRSVLSGLHAKYGNDVTLLGCDASDEAVAYAKAWSEASGRSGKDSFTKLNAKDPVEVMSWVGEQTDGELCDVTVNLVNVPYTEMPAVLATKNKGKVIFFSMATDFQRATLGSEAVGKDIQLIMGSGYVEGHASHMMGLLKSDAVLRAYFDKEFGDG